MSSIANVFDSQAAGYERQIRENWDSLQQWERDYYTEFSAWAGNKQAVKRRILTPERRGYHSSRIYLSERELPLTIGLAYALIVIGVFIATLPLQGAALGVAALNVARGHWGHGLAQFALAAVAIALYRSGVIEPGQTYRQLLDLIQQSR